MKTDWNTVPKHTIAVGKLNSASEICELFKDKQIRKYVYRIKYKGIVLKYGMSTDRSKNFGERLYRQIAHAESWGDKRISGSSGADYRIIEDDFYKRYDAKIDIKDLEITVYDMTKYQFQSIHPDKEVYHAEQELIESYKHAVGEKPIGNINDDPHLDRRGYISKGLFGSKGLFED